MRARFGGTADSVHVVVYTETPEERILFGLFQLQQLDKRRRPRLYVASYGGSELEFSFTISPGQLPPGILTDDGRRHGAGCEVGEFHLREACRGADGAVCPDEED
jgi:hypothetical protein